MRPAALILALILAAPLRADSQNQHFSDFTTPLPVRPGDTLILGIVGGWERWDNPVRAIRRTAIHLKRARLAHTHIETVENHKLHLAEELVRKAFDFNRDGHLSPEESAQARILVYGQSLGGGASLDLARSLQSQGVAVRLLILIDSFGRDTCYAPPNVREAINFFQRDNLVLRGADDLRAQDPARTTILGNIKISLDDRPDIVADEHSLPHRLAFGAHARLEYHPELWTRIEQLLTSTAAQRD